MAKVGTNGVADNMSKLTGEDAQMEVTKTNFIDVDDIGSQLDGGKRVGVRVRLLDPPHGHILILFPEASAKKITAIMLRDVVDDMGDVSGKMARSAVEEMGNMMASGFIDGWADVLGRAIDIAAPSSSTRRPVTSSPGRPGSVATTSHCSSIRICRFRATRSKPRSTHSPDLEEFVEMVNGIEVHPA